MPPWDTHPEVRRYNPYLNDVATQFLPWAKAMRSAWAEASAPWRDRWNGCGTPLAADGQSAAFSPLPLLALPLPSAFLLSTWPAVCVVLWFLYQASRSLPVGYRPHGELLHVFPQHLGKIFEAMLRNLDAGSLWLPWVFPILFLAARRSD